MITEREQVERKYWDEGEHAYMFRIDEDTRRRIWFAGTGRSGVWIIQMIDNEGNQIGDSGFAANKNSLRS